jgi:hypothetical protein
MTLAGSSAGTVRNTWDTFTDAGFRTSIAVPATEIDRLHWFGSVPMLDVWPVWILLWGGPKWLYLLTVVFLLCAVTGLLVLTRAVRSPRTS